MKEHDTSALLSTLPAGPQQRRLALVVVAVSAFVFAAALPWAKLPLARVPAFIAVYQSALAVCDLLTAVLLFGQYAMLRRRAMLVLSVGYLFTALMAGVHMLTFPGLFAPQGWLNAGPQSTVWLYMFWHGGFPLFLIAYAVRPRGPVRESQRRVVGGIVGAVIAAALAVAALTLVATVDRQWLPPLLDNGRYLAATHVVTGSVLGANVLALVLLWRRRPQSILDLWLAVVACAWLFDITLSAVLNGARFDLGFYVGRLYGLLAATFVLSVLLLENGMLYARLVKARRSDRRRAADARLLGAELALANELMATKSREVEEASRLKSEFLSHMSHELRTPLNAVIGFAELMKDGMTGDLQPQQAEFVGHIHRSGQHLLALINDILDLSKIEAGKAEIELEPVEPGTLFDDSLVVVATAASAAEVKLARDGHGTSGLLMADRRRLRQILLNLLSNAIKFTPRGGRVTLRDRRVDSARVRIGPEPCGAAWVHFPPAPSLCDDYLEISISDTGVGITPEDAQRLFTPFTRVGDAAARAVEGTGLGLTMVKRLADLHGGGVALASGHGTGSTFTVWLPWRSVGLPKPVEALPRQTPQTTAASPLALVIEDNEESAMLMKHQLELEGFRVQRVASAEAALELGRTLGAHTVPAVITVDIRLPGMDGWEFIARLEKLQPWAHVPVVVVSVLADHGRGFSLGASLVLQKPLQRDALAAGLARLGLVPGGGREVTVLIIDDDPHAVEILATQLRQSRYKVLRAFGGSEGIDLARHFRPDLIALDLEMPEVNGFDVAEALAADETTAGIPIVIVTVEQPTQEQRQRLNGHILDIVDKAHAGPGRFIGEVRRALGRVTA